jgi:predicted RNA binding protein YcfA (HicA-like mRNA interferase family)
MSGAKRNGDWPSIKASRLFSALVRIGWVVKRSKGSHRVLARPGFGDFVFAFHDRQEIGPKMLAHVARHTGLKPSDL